jgi:hypothetical protein
MTRRWLSLFKPMDDLKLPRHTTTKMAELFEAKDDLKLSRAHDDPKLAELFETMDDLKISRCTATKTAELFETDDHERSRIIIPHSVQASLGPSTIGIVQLRRKPR